MGLAPDRLPGGLAVNDPDAAIRLAGLWGDPAPAKPGLDQMGMLAAAREGRIKGLYIFGENTLAAAPDGLLAREALEKTEFLVVQDLFLTETAKAAHVVLPSTAWAEKVGSATNIERRVQPLKIAVPSPGDYPNDLDVFSRLAERLGSPWPALGLAEVRKEIERAVGAYTDVFDADLANRAVFWPLAGVEEVVDTLPHGIGRADGKGLFLAPSPTGRPAAGEDEYPFILMRGHILTHLGSGSRSGRSKRLMMAVDRAVLGAAPGDMDILGLTDGALVRVASARGELVVPVQAAPELPAGVVFLPASFPEARPNVLFNGAAGEAKHCRVRLEKI
jgi:predicted molibdopterin-dependent oxidoreductase YjgC